MLLQDTNDERKPERSSIDEAGAIMVSPAPIGDRPVTAGNGTTMEHRCASTKRCQATTW